MEKLFQHTTYIFIILYNFHSYYFNLRIVSSLDSKSISNLRKCINKHAKFVLSDSLKSITEYYAVPNYVNNALYWISLDFSADVLESQYQQQ